jgi:hypothetical protein
MKLKALITLLSGVLEAVATILFGTAEQRLIEDKDEQKTLVYVALKTLANAKTYEQVLDALGYFSEAMDYVEDKNSDLIDRVEAYKLFVKELQADKEELAKTSIRRAKEKCTLRDQANAYSKECDLLKQELARTQKALGASRIANNDLRDSYRKVMDQRLETMHGLNGIIDRLETKCNSQDKLLDQYEQSEIHG